MKTFKKVIIVIVVLLALAAGFLIVAGNELAKVIFPWVQTEFSYDMEPVIFKTGSVTYKIPKAYLHNEHQMNGGNHNPAIWASWKEDMTPWTLSNGFKNNDEDGRIYIYLHRNKNQHLDLVNGELKRMLERKKRLFPEYYHEVDRGEFLEVFKRYDDIARRHIKGKSEPFEMSVNSFYLVPLGSTPQPFLIKCPIQMETWQYCNVRTYTTDGIYFRHLMRFGEIKNYIKRSQRIERLINQFIVKEEIN